MTVAGVIQAAAPDWVESLVLHEFEDAMDTMAWGPIHRTPDGAAAHASSAVTAESAP